ncbi:MAG: hypothetical protein WCT14_20830, partial [Treponemataceae bacterium]
LKSMNEITIQVRAGSQEMSAGNAAILDEMERLLSSAQEIHENVNEMSSGADEINGGTRQAAETADATRETIQKMDAAIGCFKTGS